MKALINIIAIVFLQLACSCNQTTNKNNESNSTYDYHTKAVNDAVKDMESKTKFAKEVKAKYIEEINIVKKTRQNFTSYYIMTLKNKYTRAINSIKFTGKVDTKNDSQIEAVAVVYTYIAPGATQNVTVDFSQDDLANFHGGKVYNVHVKSIHFTDNTEKEFDIVYDDGLTFDINDSLLKK